MNQLFLSALQTDLGFEQTAFPFMCLVLGLALSTTMTLCERAFHFSKRNKLPTHGSKVRI